MAHVVYHEHPTQGGQCLSGAMADYVARIPTGAFRDLDDLWQSIRRRPYERDTGRSGCDDRCEPAQRARIWPPRMNCYEATAHFVAGATRFLDDTWTVHVWDRDLPNGARHVWPSLMSPKGDHMLVDLETVAPRDYPARSYTGMFTQQPANEADEWYNQILGGAHWAGSRVLKVFGLGGAGPVLEDVEGDELPDWAKDNPSGAPPADEDKPAPKKKPAAQDDEEAPPPKKKPKPVRRQDEDDDSNNESLGLRNPLEV